MEEQSVHGRIGDINSAEAVKSKHESVNIESSSASSQTEGNRDVVVQRRTLTRTRRRESYANLSLLKIADLLSAHVLLTD